MATKRLVYKEMYNRQHRRPLQAPAGLTHADMLDPFRKGRSSHHMGDPRADPCAAHGQMPDRICPAIYSGTGFSTSKRTDEQVKQAIKHSQKGALGL